MSLNIFIPRIDPCIPKTKTVAWAKSLIVGTWPSNAAPNVVITLTSVANLAVVLPVNALTFAPTPNVTPPITADLPATNAVFLSM